MNEEDCGKAKTACNWTKQSADGKRKAHCGMRGETKYSSMPDLRAFNAKKYKEEVQAARELTPEEIKQARWAKAAESVETVRAKLPFGKNGSFCVGMTESDCSKAKAACQWTKASADGKKERKAHCGRRVDKKVSYGGESDPVLRLFYGY
jgi:hypothetical protein